jgi:hypothetical protein
MRFWQWYDWPAQVAIVALDVLIIAFLLWQTTISPVIVVGFILIMTAIIEIAENR